MDTPERVRAYADAFHLAALERFCTAMDALADKLAQDPVLLGRLQAADVEFIQRQALMDRLLPASSPAATGAGADQLVRNLAYSLLQEGHLELLPEIAAALRRRAREAEAAPVQVEVISAVPLTDAERAALIAKLAAGFGSGQDIHYRVDPAILGGLVVRVGDKLIDGSLAARLAAMKQTLGVTSKG